MLLENNIIIKIRKNVITLKKPLNIEYSGQYPFSIKRINCRSKSVIFLNISKVR